MIKTTDIKEQTILSNQHSEDGSMTKMPQTYILEDAKLQPEDEEGQKQFFSSCTKKEKIVYSATYGFLISIIITLSVLFALLLKTQQLPRKQRRVKVKMGQDKSAIMFNNMTYDIKTLNQPEQDITVMKVELAESNQQRLLQESSQVNDYLMLNAEEGLYAQFTDKKVTILVDPSQFITDKEDQGRRLQQKSGLDQEIFNSEKWREAQEQLSQNLGNQLNKGSPISFLFQRFTLLNRNSQTGEFQVVTAADNENGNKGNSDDVNNGSRRLLKKIRPRRPEKTIVKKIKKVIKKIIKAIKKIPGNALKKTPGIAIKKASSGQSDATVEEVVQTVQIAESQGIKEYITQKQNESVASAALRNCYFYNENTVLCKNNEGDVEIAVASITLTQ